MRYILHYTDPGDIVFDGFCGTGMTGVAAQLCGDRKAVEELGYQVDNEGFIHASPFSQSLGEGGWGGEGAISRLGARKAVLVDLCPAATFIAYNYNTPVDVAAFEREAKRILREVEEECGWMYETWHPHCDHPQRVKARINFTVWSDVLVCPQCGEEMIFWDVAVDKEAKTIRRTWECPGCLVVLSKSPRRNHGAQRVERAWETVYDRALGHTIRQPKQSPVIINYNLGRKRYEKIPDTDDLASIERVQGSDIPYWHPTEPMMLKGTEWGDTWRAGVHAGITHIHHFYSRRNLWVLSAIWHRLRTQNLSPLCDFLFTSTLPWTTKLNRLLISNYFHKKGGVVAPTLPGTLYISSVGLETNPLERFRLRVRSARYTANGQGVATACQSATRLPNMPGGSVDYMFVDPPFGDNLMYSELNFMSEAWMRVITNTKPEAIINKTQTKGLPEYLRLMESSFHEFFRVLKPGRWITVEFHNSKNTVWNSIQQAILHAGLIIADVRVLEKIHKTFKQVTTSNAVKKDLVITAYKPRTGFERRFLEQAGTNEGAWDFVRQHLAQLPVVVKQDGALEVLSERQAYLLFDRMVAFHIQRGATVPLSAAEFYAGVRERFVERDGMFFLPDQVPEYDRARLQATDVAQLTLFVSDEKSSIQWLRQQLDPTTGGHPQTYQDIQPQFLRQLHQARHETLPELSEILEQNFLQDEAGRWYVPDPNRASDLEKLRQRALLREFAGYTEGRGRLRQFRTEAVRAGFADAWHRRNYAIIVKVAERLPERVLQEDPDLLMYYDNATLRVN
jgi:predicted RNA-binding Zn-ribbon protein involved in translation (DUF1610 family)